MVLCDNIGIINLRKLYKNHSMILKKKKHFILIEYHDEFFHKTFYTLISYIIIDNIII